MSSNNINDKFNELLGFESEKDEIEFETAMLHLDLIEKIQKLMDKKNINKQGLADKLNVSKSYVSQLFSGDKYLNLEKLAKIQRIFDVSLNFNFRFNDFDEYIGGISVIPS